MQKYKLMRMSVFAILLFNLSAIALTSTQATDGTAGVVEYSSNTYLVGSLVSIHCESLTVSADFTLSFTAGGPSNITFSTSAGQTTFDITLVMTAPTAGTSMAVELTGGTNADGATLSKATMVKQVIGDLLPEDLLIDVGIAVMVILIVVGIIAGLAIVGKRRMG